jgi:hypothetical protein
MGYEETVMGGEAKPVGGTALPGGTTRSVVVKALISTTEGLAVAPFSTALLALGFSRSRTPAPPHDQAS